MGKTTCGCRQYLILCPDARSGGYGQYYVATCRQTTRSTMLRLMISVLSHHAHIRHACDICQIQGSFVCHYIQTAHTHRNMHVSETMYICMYVCICAYLPVCLYKGEYILPEVDTYMWVVHLATYPAYVHTELYTMCMHVSVCLLVYAFVRLCVCVSGCLCVCVSVRLCLSVSVCLCLSPSVSVCLSVCLSVDLSVCLSVCLSVDPLCLACLL